MNARNYLRILRLVLFALLSPISAIPQNAAVTVNVDANLNRHPIDSKI